MHHNILAARNLFISKLTTPAALSWLASCSSQHLVKSLAAYITSRQAKIYPLCHARPPYKNDFATAHTLHASILQLLFGFPSHSHRPPKQPSVPLFHTRHIALPTVTRTSLQTGLGRLVQPNRQQRPHVETSGRSRGGKFGPLPNCCNH
jgi:hypothetical protein